MALEPIDPETAVELCANEMQTEKAEATIRSHKYRLGHFVRWCDEGEITNLNNLTGRNIHEFRLWRRNEGDLAKTSVKSQMDTLRVFIRWLGTIDGVDPELHLKVRSPDLRLRDDVRDVMLATEDAEESLAYLERYEYASLPHVTFALLWHTMMRMGAAHALDVGDYSPEDQYLSIVHRPDTETPIKNGERGERLAGLSGEVCILIDDWLRDQRPDVRDDHGREPLLATSWGLVSKSTIRDYTYHYTQPCQMNNACPHGHDPGECRATHPDHRSKCPSSISPHAIRRGSITHHLTSDVPDTAVSDRANVSTKVIEKHYDQRSKRERRWNSGGIT